MNEKYYYWTEERTRKLNTIHLAQLQELVGLLPYAFINQEYANDAYSKLERKVQKLHTTHERTPRTLHQPQHPEIMGTNHV